MKLNLSKTIATTARDGLFFDIKPDSRNVLRFLPPTQENGSLFFLNVNHFNLKSDEDKGMALACGDVHRNDGDDCYLCKVAEWLKRTGEDDIAQKIRPSKNYYAQVLVGSKDAEGQWTFSGPKMVRFSQTGADAIIEILKAQELVDDDFACDPHNGQNIVFSRNGAGLQTKYSAQAMGNKNDLDEIFPGWESKLLDIPEKLDMKIWDNDEMKAALVHTFGDVIDWDALEADIA